MAIEDGTLSDTEKVEAVLRDDSVFAAGVIPPKAKGSIGRPRTYPDFWWKMWPELMPIYGSHRKLERELRRGGLYDYIRRRLVVLRPELPALPEKPPRRQDYQYYRETYLIRDESIERLLEEHTEVTVRQAVEGGYLDPAGPGSFTHPDITRTVFGDGTVVPALIKAKSGTTMVNRRTGEVRPVRFDPDAALHTQGGGKKAWGLKYAFLEVRGPSGTFILGLEDVRKGKDEPTAMLNIARRVVRRAPGAQALVYDMIARGEHLQVVMTELGLVPVVGVHAKENPAGGEGRRARTYVPKTADLELIPVRMADGTERLVQISAYDGAVSVKEPTETGEPHYDRLRLVRLQRHEDRKSYQFYGYYELPEEYGGAVIAVRHHGNADDKRRGLNRAEVLRPIPEGTDDHARLNVLRPGAEAVNRDVKRPLHENRASALGWRRELVDLVGRCRLINAITLARCRTGARPAAA